MRYNIILILLSFCSLASVAQIAGFDPHLNTIEKELTLPDIDRETFGMIPLYDSIIQYNLNAVGQPWNPYSLQYNFVYDQDRNNLSFDNSLFYQGSWYLQHKTHYTYNDDNKVLRKTIVSFNNDTLLDAVSEYDLNGNRVSYIMKELILDIWYLSYRQTRTYDNNNNMLTSITERRISPFDSLEYIENVSMTYQNNLLTTSTSFEWKNGTWVNYRRDLYTRNANGLPSEVLVQGWTESGVWNDITKHFYTYDQSGNNTVRLTMRKENGQFVNSVRIRRTFVGDKVLTYEYALWETDWVVYYKENNEYDANLNMLRHRCYDLVNGEFVQYDDIRQTFDNDNIMTINVHYLYDLETPLTLLSADSTVYVFTKVVGKNEVAPATNVSIYPNPASGKVRIVCDETVINTGLYSLSGSLIATLRPSSGIIDLSSQKPGIYLLKIMMEKEVVCRKVIVN